ncbi:MAG TPA: hypothetical protein VET89_03625 [Stellaceae bacterium]|nr:hypothetical protein [Stellaceae bacterium]
MALRSDAPTWLAAILACGLWGMASASAQQGATLRPIPAAECQRLAAQTQEAVGIKTAASEDDFTDLVSGIDGRSCHITGSASDLAIATPAELIGKAARALGDWRSDPARDAVGPNGSEKGYVQGNRIATIQANWEPGPGVTCSDQEPLSACKIAPQQRLWNLVIDVVEQAAK